MSLRTRPTCSFKADRRSCIAAVNSSDPSGAAITWAHRASILSFRSIWGSPAVGCQTTELQEIRESMQHDWAVITTLLWDCDLLRVSAVGESPSLAARTST